MRTSSPRIKLRPLRTEDLQDFLSYRSDPAVCRWQGFGVFTETEARRYLRKYPSVDFEQAGVWQQLGIEYLPEQKIIGDCAIRLLPEEKRHVDLGLTLAPAYQGRGLGYEAMVQLLDFLFQHGIHKCMAQIDERNEASVKLIERLGFHLEGHLRKHFWNQAEDRWDDEYLYALLAEAWKPIRDQVRID